MLNEEYSELLKEGRFLDWTIVTILIKRLLTPIKKWKAYKLELIDYNGKVIRSPETSEEKNALTILDRLILYLKGFLTKRNLTLLAGFLLLKENQHETDETIDIIMERVNKSKKALSIYEKFNSDIKDKFEDEDEFWNSVLHSKL